MTNFDYAIREDNGTIHIYFEIERDGVIAGFPLTMEESNELIEKLREAQKEME